MSTQLGLDGRETPLPLRRPRPLTHRQRELVAYIRACFPVSPQEVGTLMHAGRAYPCAECAWGDRPCRHASSDGVDALKRLAARGLVKRESRGKWVPRTEGERWAS